MKMNKLMQKALTEINQKYAVHLDNLNQSCTP